MARSKRRRAYPGDLTDGQWAVIEAMIPAARAGGRPRRMLSLSVVQVLGNVVTGAVPVGSGCDANP
jgi:transposase